MTLPQKENLIVAELEKMIFSGTLKKGDKIPSEYELAERYGVSKLTANKAVTRLVERGLCMRLGGRGGTVVAESEMRLNGTILYFLPLLSGGMFSSKLLRGAALCAISRGYALQYYEIRNQSNYWNEIKRIRPAGVLCTSAVLPPPDCPVPVIAANSSYFPDAVTSDDFSGGCRVAELFYSLGHRNVAILSDSGTTTYPRRVSGFMAAWKKYFPGFNTEKMYISTVTDYNPEVVWAKMRNAVPGLTGVFCYSDTVAFRLMFYLQKQGISCPGDFSICGYGYMPMIQQMIALTSVNQYPEDMGHSACEKLLDIIEGKGSAPGQILIPVELVNVNATVGVAKERK